ncbi:MAG: hypothetical protein MUF05_06615 [Candidatus Omnitrophica bacterium]|jgi:hypothetical protein|nr:hypothetical protein [Candidatus Omnitrophota bacterium]
MNKKAQTTAEYFVIMAVVIAAIVSAGFIMKMKGSFKNYFNTASGAIVNNVPDDTGNVSQGEAAPEGGLTKEGVMGTVAASVTSNIAGKDSGE